MEELVKVLKEKNLTLSCAESLTAGLFASRVASIPGVSSFFRGGVVTYTAESKEKIINVPNYVIKENGVVSSECASWMARGVNELFKTDISVSFTGNAGPGVLEGKPVGLVYIGFCIHQTTITFEYEFTGSRNEIREKCVQEATKKLLELI